MPAVPDVAGRAPDLDTLLDFETQLEVAVRGILKEAGLVVLDPYLPPNPVTGEPMPMPDDGVVPELDVGGSTGDRSFLPTSAGLTSTEDEYSVYAGRLTLTGYVPVTPDRGEGGVFTFIPKLRQRRALCRRLFMESRWPFDQVNLPWLDVIRIQPANPQRGSDDARGLNWFTLAWDFTFAIRQTAWPIDALGR